MIEKKKKLLNPGGPDLNQYLHSPRPGSWLILLLVLALMIMVLIWAFLGNMKTTISVTGIHKEGHFTGFLMPKDALSLKAGMELDYHGETIGVLTDRSTMALTTQEASDMVENQYYLSQMKLYEYNLIIQGNVEPDDCPEGVITLEIVVAETRPFDFLMN